MKACVLYGKEDLRVEDIAKQEPKPNEVRIKMAYVGICGSDQHYFSHGKIGQLVVQEPLVLGHELSGVVDKVGENVVGLSVGQKVAVNPSDECGQCEYCMTGRQHLCPEMKYLGTAATMPHAQGLFTEFPVVKAQQCLIVDPDMDLKEAAVVEPLAIALHAASNAPKLLAKKVFISGAGPIGCLLAAVAKLSGAAEVVVSDIVDTPLEVAKKMGATRVVNALDRESIESLDGQFDVCFEASGATAGMLTCLHNTKRGGIMVHVGFFPVEELLVPVNSMIMRKELTIHGTLRAFQEFPQAVTILNKGLINVKPLITGVYRLDEICQAIEDSKDKNLSVKMLVCP